MPDANASGILPEALVFSILWQAQVVFYDNGQTVSILEQFHRSIGALGDSMVRSRPEITELCSTVDR